MKRILVLLGIFVIAAIIAVSCSNAAPKAVQTVMESEIMDDEEHPSNVPATPEQEEAKNETPGWYKKELTDVYTGMVFRVEDFKGRVVLVETMAMWCSKCLKQQQEVARLHDLLGEREDFMGLGVDIDPNEDVPQLTEYVKRNGFDWLYVVASDELINVISDLYGAQYLNPPSTPMLIIDRQGEAHLLPFGIKSAESLLEALQPYLNDSV